MIFARRDPVVDFCRHSLDRTPVGRMIIAVNDRCILPIECDLKQFKHVVFDRLWVGSTKVHLELLAPSFLHLCHAALASQFAVGEVNEKVGALLNRNVMMHWIVLAVFEGLEAVDNNFGGGFTVLHEIVMQQDTVAPNAGDVPINSLWADLDVPGNLAAGHAADGLHEDELVEVWALLPVRGGESLGAEGAFAGLA